jgi:2-oxoglutarate/2-oxoacid ferredoxin oxidoreductase subunit beta
MPVEPHKVAKMSGIGCSSKTPAYLPRQIARLQLRCTVACRRSPPGPIWPTATCIYLGVSGDGDTASIGMGQFIHVLRRDLNMTYMVMNNGCYGLTKGQDSATADRGSKSKKGSAEPL